MSPVVRHFVYYGCNQLRVGCINPPLHVFRVPAGSLLGDWVYSAGVRVLLRDLMEILDDVSSNIPKTAPSSERPGISVAKFRDA